MCLCLTLRIDATDAFLSRTADSVVVTALKDQCNKDKNYPAIFAQVHRHTHSHIQDTNRNTHLRCTIRRTTSRLHSVSLSARQTDDHAAVAELLLEWLEELPEALLKDFAFFSEALSACHSILHRSRLWHSASGECVKDK